MDGVFGRRQRWTSEIELKTTILTMANLVGELNERAAQVKLDNSSAAKVELVLLQLPPRNRFFAKTYYSRNSFAKGFILFMSTKLRWASLRRATIRSKENR